MIQLDGHGVTISDAWRIAVDREACGIPNSAAERMSASRALAEDIASQSRAVYGINTGFGPLSASRVQPEDLPEHQVNLLHHLSVGQGALFNTVETRAIMLARANALTRGYSGIRTEVVQLLVDALNAGLHPEIPSEGSVGASGDLVPLAHLARTLTGRGHVQNADGRHPADQALAAAGLTPVELQAKEGLALVNGTSVMTGLAAVSMHEAQQLMAWMEWCGACLYQVLNAAPEVLCLQLHHARGFRGQSEVAERITEHLRTHPTYRHLIDEHMWGTGAKSPESGTEIQDAYSIRCVPQILGAVQESFWHITEIVERELNASTDNPLVFPATESVIHGGNFYGQQISMACDYMRIGLAKMALLADRQIDRLVNWRYSQGLPPMLTGAEPGLHSGMMGCQLLATSLTAECRVLSTPASVQTIPTNANNQDIVSMGCTSAKMTRELMDKLWTLVAVESLALVQAADLRPEGTMGSGYAEFHAMIREISPRIEGDRPLTEDIAAVCDLLRSDAARERIGLTLSWAAKP